jgi:hypothetical protein
MKIKKRAKSVSFGKKEPTEAEEKSTEVKKVAAEPKKEAEKKAETHHSTKSEHEAVKEEKEKESKEEEKVASVEGDKDKDGEDEDLEKQLKELRVASNAAAEGQAKGEKEDKEEAPKEVEEKKPEAEAAKEEKSPEPAVVHINEKQTDTTEKEEPKSEADDQKDLPDPFVKSTDKTEKGSFFNDANFLNEKKKDKNPFVFFIIVAAVSFVLGLAVMAGVSYVFKDAKDIPMLGKLMNKPEPTIAQQKESTTIQTEAAEPTALPTPTPKDVDVSKYTVKVLNGSGVSGQAAKVKNELTTAGFTVVSTGNANSSDYTKTEITVKKTVSKEALAKLQTELGKTYKVSTATATTTQTADIVIIIGTATK